MHPKQDVKSNKRELNIKKLIITRYYVIELVSHFISALCYFMSTVCLSVRFDVNVITRIGLILRTHVSSNLYQKEYLQIWGKQNSNKKIEFCNG